MSIHKVMSTVIHLVIIMISHGECGIHVGNLQCEWLGLCYDNTTG